MGDVFNSVKNVFMSIPFDSSFSLQEEKCPIKISKIAMSFKICVFIDYVFLIFLSYYIMVWIFYRSTSCKLALVGDFNKRWFHNLVIFWFINSFLFHVTVTSLKKITSTFSLGAIFRFSNFGNLSLVGIVKKHSIV